VALVTGASSGIGAAVAREYARQGADVVLTARREDRLSAVADEIEALGSRALPIVCDVTRETDLEAVVERTRREMGRIDHVVANAGFGVAGRCAKLSLDDYRRQFETNVFGVLRTVYAALDELVASRGCLAIVGSVNGYVSLPGVSPYCMSKAAVHALAGALWHELAPLGVGVVLIVPGFVESEIRQVDNLGRYRPEAREPVPAWLRMPSDRAARKIVRAVCARKRVLVFTGHGRLAVLLQRHFPGLLAFVIRRIGVRGRSEARG
jgi:short-subunit dehydrogenase